MKRSAKLVAATGVAVACLASLALADEQYGSDAALVGSMGSENDRVGWREDYLEDRCSHVPCGNNFLTNQR